MVLVGRRNGVRSIIDVKIYVYYKLYRKEANFATVESIGHVRGTNLCFINTAFDTLARNQAFIVNCKPFCKVCMKSLTLQFSLNE